MNVDTFIKAAENGDLQQVQDYIDGGGDVDAMNRGGYTALLLACKKGHIEIAQYLIMTKGANVKAKSNGGSTALHWACKGGYLSVVKNLIAKKADLNAKNHDGSTSLILACKRGYLDIAKELMTSGADVNAQNNKGGTVLMNACEGGHLDVVRYLIDQGANMNAHRTDVKTALMGACFRGRLEVAQYLVSQGADINAKNSDGCTALMSACEEGRVAVAHYLIAQEADVKAKSNDGSTALHWACDGGYLSVVKELVAKGSDVNAKDNDGSTALMLACEEGHIAVAEYLIAKGADVNAKNKDGCTALMLACEEGHVFIPECLISHGADVNVRNNGGYTVLLLACKEGNIAVAQYLIMTKGADVNVKCNNDGSTVLHYACKGGHLSVVKNLIDKEADVNAMDDRGFTSLMLACKKGYSEVAEYLRTHGADVNARNYNEETALMLASRSGSSAIVELLVKYGADLMAVNKYNADAESIAKENNFEKIVDYLYLKKEEKLKLEEEAKKLQKIKAMKKDKFNGDNEDVQASPSHTKPLSDLSVKEVTRLLESLKLTKYCDAFEENEVDGAILVECDSVKEVLVLGIPETETPFAKKIFNNIIQFNDSGVPLELLGKGSLQVPDVINCDNDTVVSGFALSTITDASSIKKSTYTSDKRSAMNNNNNDDDASIAAETDDTSMVMEKSRELLSRALMDPNQIRKSTFTSDKRVPTVESLGDFASNKSEDEDSSMTAAVTANESQFAAISQLTDASTAEANKMIQKPLEDLTELAVHHLLESLNLTNYIEIFKKNEVDGRTLQNCRSEEDVKQLGITMTAKARVLLNEIEKRRSLESSVEQIDGPKPKKRDTILLKPEDNDTISIISDNTKPIKYRSAMGYDEDVTTVYKQSVVTTRQGKDKALGEQNNNVDDIGDDYCNDNDDSNKEREAAERDRYEKLHQLAKAKGLTIELYAEYSDIVSSINALKYLEAENNYSQAVEQDAIDMNSIEALIIEIDRLKVFKATSSNIVLSVEQVRNKIELFIQTHDLPRKRALTVSKDISGLVSFIEVIAELKKHLEDLKSDSFVGDNMIEKIDDDNIDVQASPALTKSLSELSVDDVGRLLESLNLINNCAVFQENEIDGLTLMNCKSEQDVKTLRINIVAKARMLYEEIVKLKSLTLLSEEVPAMINYDDLTTVFSELTYAHTRDIVSIKPQEMDDKLIEVCDRKVLGMPAIEILDRSKSNKNEDEDLGMTATLTTIDSKSVTISQGPLKVPKDINFDNDTVVSALSSISINSSAKVDTNATSQLNDATTAEANKIQKPLKKLTESEVHHLLESLNLDGRTFRNCHSEEDIKQLGFTITARARELLNEIEKRNALHLINVLIDDYKSKMWWKCGKKNINKDEELLLYELAVRLNRSSSSSSRNFECFAMRDIVSETCGLAVIVPDGYFKTDEEVEEFINSNYSSCGNYCSIWIREISYETEDCRFNDEISTEIMSSEFEGQNSNSFVVKKSHSLSVKETLGAVGFTCGPYVNVDGNWENDVQSLWIYSKFKDLIPIQFPTDILGGKYVVIRVAQQLCSDSYDARTVGEPLYSGLKVQQRLYIDKKLYSASQSLGPFISVTKRDSGEVQKGYLTTMHGQKLTIENKEIKSAPIAHGCFLRYLQKKDIDDTGIYVSLQAATCSNLKYDRRIPVSINDENYTVGVDFCIAMDATATRTKVLDKKGICRDLNGIVGVKKIAEENLGVIHKVGFKTGNTVANHIGTLALFKEKEYKGKPEGVSCSYEPNFDKGLTDSLQHLLLVHCPSTSPNDGSFMIKGDSGGLCYIENNNILTGVGICIGRLAASHFYQILPLALIEAVYKEKGYTVRWNEINEKEAEVDVDANNDLATEVDNGDKVTRAIDIGSSSSRKSNNASSSHDAKSGDKIGVTNDNTDVVSIAMSQASISLDESSQLSVGPFEAAAAGTTTAAAAAAAAAIVTSNEPQIGLSQQVGTGLSQQVEFVVSSISLKEGGNMSGDKA